MIRLPTEYGSLPPEYGHWIPQDYGTPVAGTEGRPDMHKLFNNCMPSTSECGNGTSYRQSQLYVILRSHFGVYRNVSPSELTPVMAAMIDYMMKPFRQLNISTTEFAALQAVMFFDPGELWSLLIFPDVVDSREGIVVCLKCFRHVLLS